MSPLRVTAAVIVAAVVAGLMAFSSAVPVSWHQNDDAILRLSLRARPERIENCRAPTQAELEQVAEHMRQRLICDGTTASYQLSVSIDGNLVDSRVVRGGGLRSDRPLQLLNEYRVAPGMRRIEVTIQRRESPDSSHDQAMTVERDSDSGTFAGRAEREADERKRSRTAAIPALLSLDTLIAVDSGRVMLVTFDPDSRSLRLPAGSTP